MIFRLLGYLFICLAMAAAAYDGTRMVADNGRLVFASFLQDWQALSPASLAWVQAWVEHFSSWLWDPLAMTILARPAWFVTGGAGVLLYLAGYQPPRSVLSDGI